MTNPFESIAKRDIDLSGKKRSYWSLPALEAAGVGRISRLPVSLVYVEECESLSAALKRECQLKPWSRPKKEALIAVPRLHGRTPGSTAPRRRTPRRER